MLHTPLMYICPFRLVWSLSRISQVLLVCCFPEGKTVLLFVLITFARKNSFKIGRTYKQHHVLILNSVNRRLMLFVYCFDSVSYWTNKRNRSLQILIHFNAAWFNLVKPPGLYFGRLGPPAFELPMVYQCCRCKQLPSVRKIYQRSRLGFYILPHHARIRHLGF